jgi:hypothetical protein
MMSKDHDDDDDLTSISKSLVLNFTECNNDYDNDDTIILASAITLDNESHE